MPPNFRELKEKNLTLTLEAFPTSAFARGTHGCRRSFPAFPRHNETPCPCSASLAGCFPAPRFPWENQPQHGDLPEASLGVRGGPVPAHGAAPCPRTTRPGSSGYGPPSREFWGKRDVDGGGVGGSCPSLGGSDTPLGTSRGQMGSPLPPASPAALLGTAPATHAARAQTAAQGGRRR